MSRIGKIPLEIPQGVKVQLNAQKVGVQGPLGQLEISLPVGIKAAQQGNEIVVSNELATRQSRTDWGTSRSLLKNMILGVTKGWKKSLELNGVGFNAKTQPDPVTKAQQLVLSVGFSHEVKLLIPKAVKCTINKNVIDLESCDRELLGTFAARVRKTQPPEPYLGKGIKYSTETIRRKAGKTGKK